MRYIKKFESKNIQDIYKELIGKPYNEFVPFLKKWIRNPEIQELLKSGLKDPSKYDEYIKVSEIEVNAKDLRPTQKEIDFESIFKSIPEEVKIKDLISGESDYLKENRLFIANNKYILDGHHRWALICALNPTCKIPCINIEIPNIEDPDKILKIVQLSIAATYNDIYIKEESKIKNNLFELDFLEIKDSINDLVPKHILKEVSEILKNLIPFLLPSLSFDKDSDNNINENYFSDVDKEDVLKVEDGLELAADIAGILDPTGAVDFANGLRYLSKGEYLYAISSFISCVPYVGDAIGKPIIFVLKSGKVGKFLLKSFSEALKKFDYVKLSALAKKMGKPFEKLIEQSKTWLPKLLNKMSIWIGKLGDKYPMIKRIKNFYNVLKKSKEMWDKCNEWLEKIKGIIKNLTEADAVDIISSNLNNLIDDNKKFINKLNIKSSLTPNPIETSLLANENPKKYQNFKGVPTRLLDKMKSGELNFKPSKKEKLKKFNNFKS